MPYRKSPEPQELLTQANAILGNGQLSLAKYLFITDDPQISSISTISVPTCSMSLRGSTGGGILHFQTRTTIDTLDYSGTGFNQGSKVVIAATGVRVRTLPTELPPGIAMPDGYKNPRIVGPGIVAIEAPPFVSTESSRDLQTFVASQTDKLALNTMPLVTLVDDSDFAARSLSNWLWTTFTRSNPASDIDGIGASIVSKHWGCSGSLVD